jgi:serine/threonine protein kinase
MIGRILSHYKVLEELSRGGMGIVYRALDVKLDRELALKVLPPELVADPERKRRFVQEAKAAAKLNHPHIGMVFEIDDADGVTFIAMELIEGEKLKDTISKDRLPLSRVLELVTEVAEGMARAHDKGIVHRDLKPANIMVTEDGHAKIIDFGLAKLVEPLVEAGSHLETLTWGETDSGKVMGTVSYMSPEQARGRKVDHRSDIFAFGSVMHELLTGQLPFAGKSGIEILNAILSKPNPRITDQDPEMPEQSAFEMQHILDKCLAKDQAERYQTFRDVIIDLRAAHRRLESGSVTTVRGLKRHRPCLYAVAATAVLVGGTNRSGRYRAPMWRRVWPRVRPVECIRPTRRLERSRSGCADSCRFRRARLCILGPPSRCAQPVFPRPKSRGTRFPRAKHRHGFSCCKQQRRHPSGNR